MFVSECNKDLPPLSQLDAINERERERGREGGREREREGEREGGRERRDIIRHTVHVHTLKSSDGLISLGLLMCGGEGRLYVGGGTDGGEAAIMGLVGGAISLRERERGESKGERGKGRERERG